MTDTAPVSPGPQRATADASAAPRTRLPLAAMLSAYGVSVTCMAVSAIAIPWLVLTMTGSATQTGLVVAAEMAPYVVMQAVAGPAVERFGPRRASWVANLGAGLALMIVPGLFVAGRLDYATLVVVVAGVGALRGLADCGSAPLVPGTARLARTPLERAAGLHASATQAGHLLGAPIAAVLLTVLSPPLVLAGSAVGFLIAAALVGMCVPPAVGAAVRPEGASEGYLQRIGAGLAFIARDPVLRAVVAMIAAGNVLHAGLISVHLPSWVREHGLEVAGVGAVAAAFGGGALAGSLIGAWIAPRVNRWAVYAFGFLTGGPPVFFALAATDVVVVVAMVAAASGLAMGGINPIVGAVQYERIPDDIMPRVLGAVKASAWVGLPLGPVLAGLLIDNLGLTPALLVVGVVFVGITVMPFVVPAFRLVNTRP